MKSNAHQNAFSGDRIIIKSIMSNGYLTGMKDLLDLGCAGCLEGSKRSWLSFGNSDLDLELT